MRVVESLFASASLAVAALGLVSTATAQSITFHKDIEPILQRSCQHCHRDGGVAPMPLVTYEQVAPFAGLIEYKTGIRDRAGAMPPWYVEKDIGIQHFKNDPSLSDQEIEAISRWARTGAPEGDVTDAPVALAFDDSVKWTLGKPDLIVTTEDFFMQAGRPDWWGEIARAPTGLSEDRYVKSVEIVEVNDVPSAGSGRETVGGRYIFHHMIWRTEVHDEDGNPVAGQTVNWPVHEVGRNPDIFDEDAGRLLRAGSVFATDSVHMHSNGRDTTGHLEIGFRFQPRGYEPKYKPSFLGLGNGVDISIAGDEKDQELHAYTVLNEHTKVITFEPHLHAPGERMCLEAIWGYTVETLSCVGYDHNWVRGYPFEDDYAPLLPKGTILHIVGYFNNTDENPNVPDPRNWQGSGNRSVTNMFIDLGIRVTMSEEQFFEAMEERRQNLDLGPNDHVIGCPLCLAPLIAPVPQTAESADDLSDDVAFQGAE
ncbi:MAG: cytochrome c [Gammaproteobacteria bacterium]|nr:cytochrome c [Pseudomonadales bacterium]MCP5348256.1 cytochrome c [Pseudomonadales bacterium]